MTPTAPHLVIVGPMGVGKTTIGRLVAEELEWPFIDSDRVIEALYGRTGSDIAQSEGVARLHRIEAEVFDDALGFAPPSVIAAAASVADDPVLLDQMSRPRVLVVLLTCEPRRLAKRAGRSSHRRPLDEAEAAGLIERRRATIEPVVSDVIDVTHLRPRAASARIVDLARSHPG